MKTILKELRAELKAIANEADRVAGERFFKEDVQIMGIKSAVLSKVIKTQYARISDKSKSNIFNLCDELFSSGIMEESFVACNWSYNVRNQYTKDDFLRFDHWVKNHVSNWATCDTLCNHTVGTLVEMYPELMPELKKWSRSDNRWVKRASAVSLIVPAKRGMFLDDVFEIAGILMMDKDDMVQKGYGWMLKVASHAHLREVFDFVMRHKDVMPRTALRYAIEKMPVEMKKDAMRR
jgi:3-methyladenine DNA glycosylase AlkD